MAEKRVEYITFISERHKEFMISEYERTGRTCVQQLAEAMELLMGKHMSPGFKPKGCSDQDIMEDVCKFYVECLADGVIGLRAREYMSCEAEEDEGYAPAAWHGLMDRFEKEYGIGKLRSLGLLTQGDKGLYDFFRDRIMTPVRNDSGEIVCFKGKAINDKVPESIKTITSPPNRYTVLQSAT